MNVQSNYNHSSSFKELTNYIYWDTVTKRFVLSHKTKTAFYNEDFKSILSEMATSDNFTVPSYKVMSSRIQKIQYRELVSGTSKVPCNKIKEQKVEVLELPAKAFKPTVYKKRSSEKTVRQTTITINIRGGKSISFNTSSPEDSVAKLLRSLEQH